MSKKYNRISILVYSKSLSLTVIIIVYCVRSLPLLPEVILFAGIESTGMVQALACTISLCLNYVLCLNLQVQISQLLVGLM